MVTLDRSIEPPIWAGMLAKHCQINNHSVEILDCEALRLDYAESAQIISDLNPKIACFVVYGHHFFLIEKMKIKMTYYLNSCQ